MEDFWDEIGGGETIKQSWINAHSGLLTIDKPYAIVCHTEHNEEFLRPASEGQSLNADVTTENWSYAWRDSEGETGTD